MLALIGIIFYMFCKSDKKKDTGTILLGFATLMFGMETMSGAVSGLKDVPEFTQLFLMFRNPILGVLVGAVLTGIIQSSSASVGILQALSVTGGVSYAAAIPIIMGQNIGTCVTAMLSSVGTNKKRPPGRRGAPDVQRHRRGGAADPVLHRQGHLCPGDPGPARHHVRHRHRPLGVQHPVHRHAAACRKSAGKAGHPAGARRPAPGGDVRAGRPPAGHPLPWPWARPERGRGDGRLCRPRPGKRPDLPDWLHPELARSIREDEERCDHYEDIIGTYLVQLSSHSLSDSESQESTELLKTIGDFERISDHAVNVLESAEELQSKGLSFSPAAMAEYETLAGPSGRSCSCPWTASARTMPPGPPGWSPWSRSSTS